MGGADPSIKAPVDCTTSVACSALTNPSGLLDGDTTITSDAASEEKYDRYDDEALKPLLRKQGGGAAAAGRKDKRVGFRSGKHQKQRNGNDKQRPDDGKGNGKGNGKGEEQDPVESHRQGVSLGHSLLAQDDLRLAPRLAAYEPHLVAIAVESQAGKTRAAVAYRPQHTVPA